MTQTAPHETPYWVVDSSATLIEKEALDTVGLTAQHDPEYFSGIVDLFANAPTEVGKVLEFISEHPEGLKVLRAWHQVIGKKLETLVEFDAETEEAIQSDPYYISTRDAFNKTNGDEILRNRLRTRRWKLFADRNAA